MTVVWIDLSTRWSLSSVQAALNVIISVLGTVGIWSFSRYWWQKGSTKVLRGDHEVPLSALFTFSGPGEGWDFVSLLRKHVFSKENWHLLVQLVVVILVTVACMFSGPIAKISLRSTRTVQKSEVGVLQTLKGDGNDGNMLDANVLWNDTIQSLNQAAFPNDQVLDYLPPSSVPWAYIASEWNPTWSMACNFTPNTVVHNVTASGNYTFYDPLNAFPAYRNTYSPSWLDKSKYRVQPDFDSWQIVTDKNPFKVALFFILIQSDPEIDDRMNTNNETLQLSMSIFRAQDFQALNYVDIGEDAVDEWRPVGPIQNASFTRTECNITRRPDVPDEDAVPWIWTNDTDSIIMAYRQYWNYMLEDSASKGLPVTMPTPEDILRFYQAYMVSVNTVYAFPSPRSLSVWMNTVQLSTVFLVIVLVFTLLTLWLVGRYLIFLKRNNSELEDICVPDGKIEWMVHAAKISTIRAEEAVDGKRVKDRDHFRKASFGCGNSELANLEAGRRPSGLARVYTKQSSISPAATNSIRDSVSREISERRLSAVLDSKEDEQTLKHTSSSTTPLNETASGRPLPSDNSLPLPQPQDQNPKPNENAGKNSPASLQNYSSGPPKVTLDLQFPGQSSEDGYQRSSDRDVYAFNAKSPSDILEIEEISPTDRVSSAVRGCDTAIKKY